VKRILIGVGVAVVIAVLWSRQTHEPLTYYSSRSYVQRANEMIQRGALKYNCRTEQIELAPGRATRAETTWFEASYLKNDVDLFNRNRELFGHFFVVDDCTLREINPFLRTVRLPFATSVQWLGNIEYSGPGSDTTLFSSNGRTILLNRWAPKQPYREVTTVVGDTTDVSGNSVHFDFASGGQAPAAEVHSVFDKAILEQRVKASQSAQVRLLGYGVPEGRIARLQSGDWLHLESAEQASKSETFLFVGERVFDRLSVVRTRNARQERTFSEEEPLLRWVGGEERDEMLTFGEGFARSMSNALQQLTPSHARELTNAFDVQLSIDRRLQSSLDAAFGDHCRKLASDVSGGEPFAASMTVMNGKSGEVLAAVSFPSSSDLESLRPVSEEERRRLLVNHNLKRHPIGSAGKPFIYASIATRQPFLLDLVIDPHQPVEGPNGPEGQHEILQYYVPNGYKLWNHGDRPMDFESALERSCNKFTVDLTTLALAAPRDPVERGARTLGQIFTPLAGVAWPKPGKHSGIHIGAEELTFAPDLGPHMNNEQSRPIQPPIDTPAVLTPGSLERIDEAPFVETYGEITGVRTYAGLAPPDVDAESPDRLGSHALQTMQYDLRPWRALVERLAAGEKPATAWKVRAAFQAVSPERVNLRFNQVTDLRNELVSLLLGGSTSQWTNLQLAEAASRLVTKREVEASLLHALNPAGQQQPAPREKTVFGALAVSDAARESVLRGMRRTILGAQGTAVGFAPRVHELEKRYPGFNVAAFSKTGSPTVMRPETKPVAAALRGMIRGGRLLYRDGAICVANGRDVVPYAAPGSAARPRYVAAIQKAARDAASKAGQKTTPAATARIAGFTDRFMRYRQHLVFAGPAAVKLDAGLPMPFHVVSGELVINRDHPIFDPQLETDSSAVYVLTLVKWRGQGVAPNTLPTPADLDSDDARVVTVVIYLDLGPGSTIAVETARQLAPMLYSLLD
jgi:cell division protein FtsI/penicillin-binding protein 2